jgi:hypothetical protein
LQEQQWNAKEKCVMYNNLHNKDLDTIIDLNSAKEIWDRLQLMHEGETSSNSSVEKEKRKRKKKKIVKRKVFS